MRYLFSKKTMTSSVGALLLCFATLMPGIASSAPVLIDPSVQLGNLAPAGAPSFVFNDGANSFGGNVQSWFDNYIIIQNEGGASGSYNFYAHNQGSFTYWDNMDTSMAGNAGNFDLSASFDSNGVLQSGGTVQITGAIAGLGISDPNTVLMTADLVGFEFSGDLVGFAINNITCAVEIVDCQKDPNESETVYFGMSDGFPGIAELNGANYRSTMTNKTTVPIPASAWLMLSGISWLGFISRRQKSRSTAS